MALTATQSKSIEGASRYFDETLTKGDYYLKGTEIAGAWHGKGADILGLGVGSKVTAEQFQKTAVWFTSTNGKEARATHS